MLLKQQEEFTILRKKRKKKKTLTLTLRDQTSRERSSGEEKHLKHDRSMIRAIVI